MNLRRRPGGDRAPLQDHVQQRLVVLAAGPAGEEPRHLIMHSLGPAQSVTPPCATWPARRRKPRCAATPTAPRGLPPLLATSPASTPAPPRSTTTPARS